MQRDALDYSIGVLRYQTLFDSSAGVHIAFELLTAHIQIYSEVFAFVICESARGRNPEVRHEVMHMHEHRVSFFRCPEHA